MDLLQQQIAYYKARASEYDEWFLRQGRYDRGDDHRQRWFDEVSQVRQALEQARPHGQVLELACGTGYWTEYLLPHAERLTAVDASSEMLALCRKRVGDAGIDYVEADLFDWHPDRQYDFVFFGFWLSHVPERLFATFWRLLEESLIPGGAVFFVDSLLTQLSTAHDHDALERNGIARRKLNDGSEFDVVKIFYDPATLETTLRNMGWDARVRSTGEFFLHGHAVSGHRSSQESSIARAVVS